MIPLSVVNQGKSTINITIDYSSIGTGSLVTMEGGIYLDEEFKHVMKRYPRDGETVVFTILDKLNVVPHDFDEHGLNSGSHWNRTNKIVVNNYANLYGRGGNGGMGAFVVKYALANTSSYRIPATKGDDGYSAVSNITTASMRVNNYGKIYSGGGGGGGGAAWEYDIPDNYAGYRWWMRANGTASGGGAPNGKKSYPVGSPEWYITVGSSPSSLNSNLFLYQAETNNPNKPNWGVRIEASSTGVVFNLIDSDPVLRKVGGIIRTYEFIGRPLNLELNKIFPNLSYFDLPSYFTWNITTDVTYKQLVASNYSLAPLSKRYADTANLKVSLTDMHIPFGTNKSHSASSLMPTDSKTFTPGMGGSTNGLLLAFPLVSEARAWGGMYWYGRPNASFIAPYAWDDNFGGDGGNVGQNGQAGYYTCGYADSTAGGEVGQHRARRMTKEYIDTNKHLMVFEPPAQGGLSGYISTGSVEISNMQNGTTVGRPGLTYIDLDVDQGPILQSGTMTATITVGANYNPSQKLTIRQTIEYREKPDVFGGGGRDNVSRTQVVNIVNNRCVITFPIQPGRPFESIIDWRYSVLDESGQVYVSHYIAALPT